MQKSIASHGQLVITPSDASEQPRTVDLNQLDLLTLCVALSAYSKMEDLLSQGAAELASLGLEIPREALEWVQQILECADSLVGRLRDATGFVQDPDNVALLVLSLRNDQQGPS